MKHILIGLLLLAGLSCMFTAFAADNARFAVLSGDNVAVRKEPSKESEKLGELPKGQKLIVIGSSGDFYKIRFRGGEGYVFDQFVAVQAPQDGTVNADYVILRDGPSTETEKLDTLNRGDKVNVYYKNGEFYQVTFLDKLGYISEQYISVGKNASSAKSSDNKSSNSDSQAREKPHTRQVSTGSFSAEELLLLARLVDKEGNGTTECYEAIATVLLNRITSSRFPNTVYEMVFQPNQFSVVDGNDFMSFEPDNKAVAAVEKVFVRGEAVLPDDVFFFKSDSLSKSWGDRDYYDTIGGNHFYS